MTNTEFEVRWVDGRRYFATRAGAICFAKSCGYLDARVLHWGNGAVVWASP